MKILIVLYSLLKNPRYLIEMLLRSKFPGHYLSDRFVIKSLFRLRFGETINLDSPRTFNEKILWLTLNDRKDIYTKMADKYEAKLFVERVLGGG